MDYLPWQKNLNLASAETPKLIHLVLRQEIGSRLAKALLCKLHATGPLLTKNSGCKFRKHTNTSLFFFFCIEVAALKKQKTKIR